MMGYTLLLASDVSDRDGLGLELYSPDGLLLAEIFRDDDNGDRRFHNFEPLHLDPEILSWFLGQAAEKLLRLSRSRLVVYRPATGH